MHLKFAIQVKKTKKWLSLDFHDGSEVIYVEKFTQAYHFESEDDSQIFLSEHKFDRDKCELFHMKVFAEPVPWR